MTLSLRYAEIINLFSFGFLFSTSHLCATQYTGSETPSLFWFVFFLWMYACIFLYICLFASKLFCTLLVFRWWANVITLMWKFTCTHKTETKNKIWPANSNPLLDFQCMNFWLHGICNICHISGTTKIQNTSSM